MVDSKSQFVAVWLWAVTVAPGPTVAHGVTGVRRSNRCMLQQVLHKALVEVI